MKLARGRDFVQNVVTESLLYDLLDSIDWSTLESNLDAMQVMSRFVSISLIMPCVSFPLMLILLQDRIHMFASA
jgi:hypothetical protein